MNCLLAKTTQIILGDSTRLLDLGFQTESFDFSFAHPPYWELIKFSNEYGKAVGDLSNETTVEGFLNKLEMGFNRIYHLLKRVNFTAC